MKIPTKIISTHLVGPYRSFSVKLEEVRKRARHALINRYEEPFQWDGVEEDALYLAILMQTLVEEKLELAERLNQLLPPDQIGYDLCPCCGGGTWSRPLLPDAFHQSDWNDYTRRRCSVCEWVRAEPDENPEAT